jgi:hypothetical protein
MWRANMAEGYHWWISDSLHRRNLHGIPTELKGLLYSTKLSENQIPIIWFEIGAGITFGISWTFIRPLNM